jgi:hypothetical protein
MAGKGNICAGKGNICADAHNISIFPSTRKLHAHINQKNNLSKRDPHQHRESPHKSFTNKNSNSSPQPQQLQPVKSPAQPTSPQAQRRLSSHEHYSNLLA